MRRFAGIVIAAGMTFASAFGTYNICFAEEAQQTVAETQQESEQESEQGSANSDFVIAQNLDNTSIPQGAEQITFNYKGQVVQAAKTLTGIYMLPVLQEDGSIKWYAYNDDTDEAIPYINFAGVTSNYTIIPLDNGVSVPSGYESVSISIANNELPAWYNKYTDDSNMYLIYAIDAEGNKGFFRFDGKTGNTIRFVEDITEPETTESVSEEPDTMAASVSAEIASYSNAASFDHNNYLKLQEKYNKDFMVGIVLLGVAVVLLIVFFFMSLVQASKLKKVRRRLAESENARKSSKKTHYSNSGIKVKPRNAERSEEAPSGYVQGKDEGTSKVRKVTRPTSVRPEEGQSVRPKARQEESEAEDKSAKISKTKKETKVFAKPPVQVDELEGLEDAEQKKAETKPEEVLNADVNDAPGIDTVGLEKIAEQLNRYSVNEDMPIENDIDDDLSDSDEDFEITNFKNM